MGVGVTVKGSRVLREQCGLVTIKTVPFIKRKCNRAADPLNLNHFLVPCQTDKWVGGGEAPVQVL